MPLVADLESPDIRLPRAKPRRLVVAATFRAFYSAQRIVPARLLARMLLSADRVVRRLAWEQVTRAMGDERAFAVLRPGSTDFVRRNVDPDARVLDVGGGPGIVTLALAEHAGQVTYVDHSERNFAIAKSRCAGLSNVDFVFGDVDAALGGRTYDVAVALHLLEHLDDPTGFLLRLREHAKRIVVEVPDFTADPLNLARWQLDVDVSSDDDHVREFTVDGLADVLKAAGWWPEATHKGHGVIRVLACHKTTGTPSRRKASRVGRP